jgi:hypothetical protein
LENLNPPYLQGSKKIRKFICFVWQIIIIIIFFEKVIITHLKYLLAFFRNLVAIPGSTPPSKICRPEKFTDKVRKF